MKKAILFGFIFIFFFKFIYFERDKERERVHVGMREGQRERGRERIPSRLLAVSMEPDVGFDHAGLDLTSCEKMT